METLLPDGALSKLLLNALSSSLSLSLEASRIILGGGGVGDRGEGEINWGRESDQSDLSIQTAANEHSEVDSRDLYSYIGMRITGDDDWQLGVMVGEG